MIAFNFRIQNIRKLGIRGLGSEERIYSLFVFSSTFAYPCPLPFLLHPSRLSLFVFPSIAFQRSSARCSVFTGILCRFR